MTWLPSEPDVLAFGRGDGLVCVVNPSARSVALPVPGEVILASGPLTDGALPAEVLVPGEAALLPAEVLVPGEAAWLPADTTVWLRPDVAITARDAVLTIEADDLP